MKTVVELRKYVSSLPNGPTDYMIGVGSLIFDDKGRVLLGKRGHGARDCPGMFEGIGGGLEDGEEDLHDTLKREIKEELGNGVEVRVEKLLMVLTKNLHGVWWVIPQFLCRLTSGIPKNMEPEKCITLEWFKIEDVQDEKLSTFARNVFDVYKEKYGKKPYYLH